MLEYLLHTWRCTRVICEYTEVEIAQLLSLQACFEAAFQIKPTNTFIDSDDRGKAKNSTTTLLPSIAEKINRGSPLNGYVNNLICEVAQYLSNRNGRLLQKGYANDPTNLFCLQILQWCTNTLAKANADEQLLTEISCWIIYFENVRANRVFSKKEDMNATKTMQVLLENLISILQLAKEHTQYEINRCTIGKHIDSFTDYGKNALTFISDYLLLVLSNRPIPINYSLINLYNPILSAEVKDIIQGTRQGQYLVSIAKLECIQTLFFPYLNSRYRNLLPNPALVPRFDQSGKISTVESEATLYVESAKANIEWEGLIPTARHNPMLVNAFTRAHGLLEVFARLLTLYADAGYLANKGGDFLACILTRDQLLFLIDAYHQLKKEIMDELKYIQAEARRIYITICAKEKPTDDEDIWQKNRDRAEICYRYVEEAFSWTSKHASSIAATISNINESAEDFKKRVVVFMKDVRNFAKETGWLVPHSHVRSKTDQFLQSKIIQNHDQSGEHPSLVARTPLSADTLDIKQDQSNSPVATSVVRRSASETAVEESQRHLLLAPPSPPNAKNTAVPTVRDAVASMERVNNSHATRYTKPGEQHH